MTKPYTLLDYIAAIENQIAACRQHIAGLQASTQRHAFARKRWQGRLSGLIWARDEARRLQQEDT